MDTTARDDRESGSMIPAIVCCATGILGTLGLVAVAAASWLLLV